MPMPDIQQHSALLWGRNEPTRRGLVRIACEELGLTRSHLYREPHKGWALREAMKDVARTFRQRKAPFTGVIEVRPLEGSLSYEAVQVHRRAVQNSEEFLFSVQLVSDQVLTLRVARGFPLEGAEVSRLVTESIASHLHWLNPSQVRNLIDRVVSFVGGVDLGGVNTFYLPPDAVPKVETFRDRSGLRGYGITKFQVSTDPETIASVTKSLGAEVLSSLSDIKSKVESGDLTRKSAQALALAAQDLGRKVQMYESALGNSLPDMRHAIHEAANSAALAALMSAAV